MVNQSPNFINRLKELKRIAAKMVNWFRAPHFTLKNYRCQRILKDGGKDGRQEDWDDCSSLSLDSIPWLWLWLGLRLGLWVTRGRVGGRRVTFLCCARASDVPTSKVSALLVSTGYGVSRSLFTRAACGNKSFWVIRPLAHAASLLGSANLNELVMNEYKTKSNRWRHASLICGSVVAPLGEKARPLEKNKACGASEGLEPLSTGATTGFTGAATYSPAAALGSTGTSRGNCFKLHLANFARYM